MKINIETLVGTIIREVIAELHRRGIELDDAAVASAAAGFAGAAAVTRAAIDLSMYKTPVLTEHHVASLEASITEIVIPKRTVITPGARDAIKRRSLVVSSDVSAR